MNDGSGAAAGLMGAGIVVILVAILIPLGIYIWTALALGAVFTKAGEPVWKAWVPVVNTWTLYELGGKPGFWALLAFLPIVNIVAFVFLIIISVLFPFVLSIVLLPRSRPGARHRDIF